MDGSVQTTLSTLWKSLDRKRNFSSSSLFIYLILRVRSILFSYLLTSIRENYIEMISICGFMDLLELYGFLISFKKIKGLITIEYSNKKT